MTSTPRVTHSILKRQSAVAMARKPDRKVAWGVQKVVQFSYAHFYLRSEEPHALASTTEPIPQVTRSEAIEQQKIELEQIFSGEDISGLVVESRRKRKSAYANVDDLLAAEFGGSGLEDQPPNGGLQSDLSIGRKRRSEDFDNFSEEFSAPDYRMRILADQKVQQPDPMILELSSSDQSRSEESDKSSIKEDLTSSAVLVQPRKRYRMKAALNTNIKRSLQKNESVKRKIQQSMESLFRSLNLSGQTRCLFSIGSRLHGEGLEEQVKVSLGPGEFRGRGSPISQTDSKKIRSHSNLEKILELVQKDYKVVSRDTFVEESTRHCGNEHSQRANVLLFFEEGVLIVLKFDVDVTADSIYSLASLDVCLLPTLRELGAVLSSEISSHLLEISGTCGGTLGLTEMLQEIQEKTLRILVNRDSFMINRLVSPAKEISPAAVYSSCFKLAKSTPVQI